MVRSTLKLNGPRFRCWQKYKNGGSRIDNNKNAVFGSNMELLKPESLATKININSKACGAKHSNAKWAEIPMLAKVQQRGGVQDP